MQGRGGGITLLYKGVWTCQDVLSGQLESKQGIAVTLVGRRGQCVLSVPVSFVGPLPLPPHTHTYTDGRLIMKQIQAIEISSFEEFAQQYIRHVMSALESKVWWTGDGSRDMWWTGDGSRDMWWTGMGHVTCGGLGMGHVTCGGLGMGHVTCGGLEMGHVTCGGLGVDYVTCGLGMDHVTCRLGMGHVTCVICTWVNGVRLVGGGSKNIIVLLLLFSLQGGVGGA